MAPRWSAAVRMDRKGMSSLEGGMLFGLALALAIANLPLLVLKPSRREQRLWRRIGIQHVRRWITRRRNPGYRHHEGRTAEISRRNIVWHAALGLILGSLILHPMWRTGPFRAVRYALFVACVAYFVGSLVQRQKIVTANLEKG